MKKFDNALRKRWNARDEERGEWNPVAPRKLSATGQRRL